jgi:capsular polysaccharide biosynthesis protein/Mrp family chromosome partitioning ATPase
MSVASRPDSFELSHYTGVLRRRWPILLVVTLIALLGTVGYIVVTPKVYPGFATVYVNPTGTVNANNLATTRTPGLVDLDTQAQMVTSGVVATLAGKTLHSSLPPDTLAKAISIAVPGNSDDMVITCRASTSTGAAACANAFANAYLQNRTASAKAAINQQIGTLKSQISSLQNTAAGLRSTISGLPSNSAERASAQTRLASYQRQLGSLNARLSTLYGQLSQTNGGSVITPARPQGRPSSPEKSLVVPSGFAVGVVVGLIAAFGWDRLDRRIRNARDVERFFGLPVLLDLPPKSLGRQVSLASPRSRTGRGFTELAHAVAASLGEGSHVVIVAGASRGPAGSVVAANLAAALARTHSEAVLVCAALRDSVAPELFGMAPGRGLAEVLAGQATVGEVASGPASAPGLWVIPPGADTSLAEYHLQHDTARALTAQLRRDARFVVVEVQAKEDGADTLALAEFADAAVLTVEAQRTSRGDAQAAIRRLRQMRTQLLGMAVVPPVREGVTIRPPQPRQPREGAPPRGEVDSRPGAGALGRSQMSSLSGKAPGANRDGRLVRPGRAAEAYGDPADRVSGS